uniref:Putative W-rich salivary secreted peptide n=1 Tax=Ochlerotatus triseriatus TaxID=7162 RepID=C6ZR05_OCHTR
MKFSLASATVVAFLAVLYLAPPVENRSVHRWPCWWGLGPEIPPSWLRNARLNESSSNRTDIRPIGLLPMIVPNWLCELRVNRTRLEQDRNATSQAA